MTLWKDVPRKDRQKESASPLEHGPEFAALLNRDARRRERETFEFACAACGARYRTSLRAPQWGDRKEPMTLFCSETCAQWARRNVRTGHWDGGWVKGSVDWARQRQAWDDLNVLEFEVACRPPAAAHPRGNPAGLPLREREERHRCLHCGEDFAPKRNTAMFCSTRCRVAEHRARARRRA